MPGSSLGRGTAMQPLHQDSKLVGFLKSAFKYRIRLLPLTSYERAFRQVEPLAIMGHRALKQLYRSVAMIEQDHIPGDVVECGVARGGSALLMALALRDYDSAKTLWLYDSFEGLPEPDAENDPDYEVAKEFVGACRGNVERVQGHLERSGLKEDQIKIVPGLFDQTLAKECPEKIALLHVDCDWYQSVKICFETLFDHVVEGGIIQIDDYFTWQGCRKAVDEFLVSRHLETKLHRIDRSAVRLRK